MVARMRRDSSTRIARRSSQRILLARDAEWATLAGSNQDVEKIVS